MVMDCSPRFPRAQRGLDEIEAAALAQEAIDAARWASQARMSGEESDAGTDEPEASNARTLTPPRLRQRLFPASGEWLVRVEHVLIAAIWLGSVGVGLFRLLM